jgi:hypothetical protein
MTGFSYLYRLLPLPYAIKFARGRGDLWCCETSRFPHFPHSRFTDGDEIVSLTRRRPLFPGRFLVPKAVVLLERFSTRNLLGAKGCPAHKADNLTAICGWIVWPRICESFDVTLPYVPPRPVTRIASPSFSLKFHYRTAAGNAVTIMGFVVEWGEVVSMNDSHSLRPIQFHSKVSVAYFTFGTRQLILLLPGHVPTVPFRYCSVWRRTESSWLQIQRSGFDFRRYQIFREVVDLERVPLSLVSTTEELTE